MSAFDEETVTDEPTITEKTYERLNMAPMKLNTPDEVIIEQVRQNIRRGLPQIRPHAENSERICIVGGGWSLNDTLDELRHLYWSGSRIVTVNGSAQWCIDRNLKPSAHVVMDARATNLRFVQHPDVPGLKYMLASQCHPSLFDELTGKEVYIWHALSTAEEGPEEAVLDKYYVTVDGRKNWAPTPGTTCVGFRAMCIMRSLGYKWFDVFGVDSCYAPSGAHHAYPQPENDDEQTITVTCAGREFRCSGWQIAQASTFRELIAAHGSKFHINFHGDGLIAHSVRMAAEIKEK